MLTLLHAADLHLDSPFRSLSPAEASRRRGEQREALKALGDIALDCHADLVLLAGDLFDSQQIYPETLEVLSRVLGALPCPVCIAPGNHDPWSERSPYATFPWPDNVHIFTSEALAPKAFPQLGVTVYGCAFTSPSREDDPLEGFRAPRDGSIPIGLVHGEVVREGRYAPISPESLGASGFRYLALGHIHQYSGLQRTGDTWWANPGCPQGRGYDEAGEKGVLVVSLQGVDGEAGAPEGVAAEFRPIPGPQYRILTADLTGRDPLQAVEEAIGKTNFDNYLRLTLTGECPRPDLAQLRAAGAALCRELELRDETTLLRDLWARAEEETLTGLFLREMRRRLEGAGGPEEQETLLLAVRFGLDALEGREDMA